MNRQSRLLSNVERLVVESFADYQISDSSMQMSIKRTPIEARGDEDFAAISSLWIALSCHGRANDASVMIDILPTQCKMSQRLDRIKRVGRMSAIREHILIWQDERYIEHLRPIADMHWSIAFCNETHHLVSFESIPVTIDINHVYQDALDS